MKAITTTMTYAGYLMLALLLTFPTASRAAESLEIVCIQCHGAQQGKLGESVKLWRQSIHAEHAIACNHCHGGDPKDAANAMSPSRGFLGTPKEKEIPAFCGKCHIGVMNDYLGSAHGRALGKGGPTCVTCHGSHGVIKASLALINETACSQCHSYERAKIIRSAMEETENRIVAIDKTIGLLKQEGVDTDKLEKTLFVVRNRFHTLFHAVDVEKVRKEAGHIATELKKQEEVLQGIEGERRQRKLYGVAAVVTALLAALFLRLLKKTYD
jgi:hypothetical protein